MSSPKIAPAPTTNVEGSGDGVGVAANVVTDWLDVCGAATFGNCGGVLWPAHAASIATPVKARIETARFMH